MTFQRISVRSAKMDDNPSTTTRALQQQSVCDNNNICDDKISNNSHPSWLRSQLSSLSALLPSNFLNLPPRWRDWFIRGQSGTLLISCFYILISLGPLGLFSLTLIVTVKNIEIKIIFQHVFQFSSYYEVIQLGIKATQIRSLTTWCWLVFLIGKENDKLKSCHKQFYIFTSDCKVLVVFLLHRKPVLH